MNERIDREKQSVFGFVCVCVCVQHYYIEMQQKKKIFNIQNENGSSCALHTSHITHAWLIIICKGKLNLNYTHA